jgi:hypothetical protein
MQTFTLKGRSSVACFLKIDNLKNALELVTVTLLIVHDGNATRIIAFAIIANSQIFFFYSFNLISLLIYLFKKILNLELLVSNKT